MKEVEVEVTEVHQLTVLVENMDEVEKQAAQEAWRLEPDHRTVKILSVTEVEE